MTPTELTAAIAALNTKAVEGTLSDEELRQAIALQRDGRHSIRAKPPKVKREPKPALSAEEKKAAAKAKREAKKLEKQLETQLANDTATTVPSGA